MAYDVCNDTSIFYLKLEVNICVVNDKIIKVVLPVLEENKTK